MRDDMIQQTFEEPEATRQALERAQALAGRGQWRAAVEALQLAEQARPTALLQRALVDLRIQGGRALAGSGQGLADPLAAGTEPRSGAVERQAHRAAGLPEVTAAELNAAVVREALSERGALLVRGLVDRERALSLRHLVDRVIAAREQRVPCEESSAAWYARSPEVHGGPARFFAAPGESVSASSSLWTVDSPLATARLLTLYHQLRLPELLSTYFGEPALLSVKKWVLRRVAPDNGAEAGWHQDGRFLGEGIATLNLWLSLSDCGGDTEAPGMEIVANGRRDILPTGSHGADFDWTVGQGLVDQVAPDTRFVPRFAPGDALIFDHFNLHRTAFGTAHTLPRYAIEAWFFAQSRAPLKQQPVLL
ncbi:MAG: hypothetical protein CME38_17765 [Haliea sp.]|nr:hypothetical protein [Haliea sp.]